MSGIFGDDVPAFTNSDVPNYSDTGIIGNPPAASGTPASMGGVPQVMPSNDWWKSVTTGAGDIITTAKQIQQLRASNGIATPSGVVSSNAQNPAPGSRGTFFQANSTGGALSGATGITSNMGLVLAAIAVVIVIALIARK